MATCNPLIFKTWTHGTHAPIWTYHARATYAREYPYKRTVCPMCPINTQPIEKVPYSAFVGGWRSLCGSLLLTRKCYKVTLHS